MMKTTPKAGSVVAAVTLTLGSWSLAACGGASLDADEQALADAIASDMQDNGDGIFDESESQCFGDEVVKKVGAERLNELGVTVETPDGLDSLGAGGVNSDEANKIYDALDGCVDLKAAMNEAFTLIVGPEAAKCISDKLPEDVLRSLMLSDITGETPDADQEAQMNEIAQECGAA